jgi:hypothetical protein
MFDVQVDGGTVTKEGMKATGAELMAFYEAWPMGSDWYHEDGTDVDDEGNLILDATAEYDVEEVIGFLCWQGDGNLPSSIQINDIKVRVYPSDGPRVEDVFRAWRGDAIGYVVRVKASEAQDLRDLCAIRGWELLETKS